MKFSASGQGKDELDGGWISLNTSATGIPINKLPGDIHDERQPEDRTAKMSYRDLYFTTRGKAPGLRLNIARFAAERGF